MALFPLHLALFFSLLMAAQATSTTALAGHHHDHQLKSLRFTLYEHGIFNETDFMIVPGIGGPGISNTTSPLGSIFVFRSPLTATSDTASEVVGRAEGVTITSTIDGLNAVLVSKITLDLKEEGIKGSFSTVGVPNNLVPSDVPINGGTEDFLFVQGYLTTTPVALKGLTFTFKVDFHLYWPPYAPLIRKV